MSVTCGRSAVSPHHQNWPPRYNWNIVESGVKHHNRYWKKNRFFFFDSLDLAMQVMIFTVNIRTLENMNSIWYTRYAQPPQNSRSNDIKFISPLLCSWTNHILIYSYTHIANSIIHKEVLRAWSSGLGVLCLTPLSTIFQ